MKERSGDEEDEAPIDPKLLLQDPAVDGATLRDLRSAFKELRTAYTKLYGRHHESIKQALADLKADDKKTGGDVPYGYRLDADGETLLEDKAEQAVIAEAVRLREVEELSYRKIAKELWRQKLRPRPVPKARRRGLLKTKRFGEFDPTQIRRMIETHKVRAKFSD